jgi:serine/threonine-protein phosphatase 2B catalytic subunit
MLLAVLSVCSAEELEDGDSSGSEDETRTIADLALTPNEIAARRQQIKNKILAVGRMQRVFQLLREEAENASELSTALGPPARLGVGAGPSAGGPGDDAGQGKDALGVQGNQVRRYIRTFDDACVPLSLSLSFMARG